MQDNPKEAQVPHCNNEDYRQGYSARSDLGGGVILTLCHPLDYLLWLIGEVSALWSFSDYLGNLDLEVEDTAEIGLRFSNGVLGSVHLNYNHNVIYMSFLFHIYIESYNMNSNRFLLIYMLLYIYYLLLYSFYSF